MSASSEPSPGFVGEDIAIKDTGSLTEKASMTVIYSLHGNIQHKLLNSVMKPPEKATAGLVWELPSSLLLCCSSPKQITSGGLCPLQQ